MTTTAANAFVTGVARAEHLDRIGARVKCALVGHEFAAGIAGIVLQLPTCQRCGHTADD